jgi:hypothetical protein
MATETKAVEATPRPWGQSGTVVFAKSVMPSHGMFGEQPAIAACSSRAARESSFLDSEHYGIENVEAVYQANAELIVTAVNSFESNQKQLAALREALKFCRDLAGEELAYARVGTGAEVALRHIERKANEALSEEES